METPELAFGEDLLAIHGRISIRGNMTNRASFFRICCIAMLAPIFLSSLAECGEEENNIIHKAEKILARGPVVQRVTVDGITVMGRPIDQLLGKQVTVSVIPSNLPTSSGAMIKKSGYYDKKRDTFLIRINGLSPSARFQYTVSIGGNITGPFHFTTAPDNSKTPFRFAIYGDTRSRPKSHKQVADAIASQTPLFILHTGDLLNDGYIKELWDEEYFGPARKLFANVPCFPCVGNHEMQSPIFNMLHDLPQKWYYSFEYGPIHFIVIDKYRIKTADGSFIIGEKQYEWIKAELRKKHCKWRIVMLHPPLFSCNPGRRVNYDLIGKLAPLFEQAGVDLVVSGHDHHYMRVIPMISDNPPQTTTYIVSGGGGAPVYSFISVPWAAKQYKGLHFLVCDADLEELRFQVLTPTGEVIDRFKIDRKRPPKILASTSFVNISKTMDSIKKSIKNLEIRRKKPGEIISCNLSLPVKNLTTYQLTGTIEWKAMDQGWDLQPAFIKYSVPPKETNTYTTRALFADPDIAPPLEVVLEMKTEKDELPVIRHMPFIRSAVRKLVRASTTPRIDGALNDREWLKAKVFPKTYLDSALGKAENSTVIRALAAPDGLCVGIECMEDDIENMRAEAKKSEDAWRDDCVEVFVDANFDRNSYNQYVVTISGLKLKISWKDGEQVSVNDSDAWSVRMQKGRQTWSAEFLIPWTELGLKRIPGRGSRMGFNICRNENNPDQKENNWKSIYSMWSLTYGTSQIPEHFGILEVE